MKKQIEAILERECKKEREGYRYKNLYIRVDDLATPFWVTMCTHTLNMKIHDYWKDLGIERYVLALSIL